MLDPVVRGVLNDAAAATEPGWSAKPIGASFGTGTLGIFLLSGEAHSASGKRAWSVVAKVMDLAGTSWPSAYMSPLSEIRAYESGLLSAIGAEVGSGQTLRAARHFGTSTVEGLGTILWIEDLSAAAPPPWDDQSYAEVGKHLGHFNANWELNKPSRQSWFLDDGFASRVSAGISKWDSMSQFTNDPLVRRAAPPDVVEDLLTLSKKMPAVIVLINAGPRPLSHIDAQPRNLFPLPLESGGFETVTIDWASVGYAPLGTDPAQVVGSSLTWCEIEPGHGVRLHEEVLAGYVKGLSEFGWNGDIELVRVAYMSAAMIRAANMLFHTVSWVEDRELKEQTSRGLRHSSEAIADQWREVFRAVYPLFRKTADATGM